jgi:acetyl esterase/lipase
MALKLSVPLCSTSTVVAGQRGDCPRPLFWRFLLQGFIVYSMDYRLLPETSFGEQLEDVKDIEPWLRNKLQDELKGAGLEVGTDGREIVVVGESAGGLLALLTVRSLLSNSLLNY